VHNLAAGFYATPGYGQRPLAMLERLLYREVHRRDHQPREDGGSGCASRLYTPPMAFALNGYEGKAPFKQALAELYELMGFVAVRDGAPGQKDVLVVAPIGQNETRFTVAGIRGAGSRAGREDLGC